MDATPPPDDLDEAELARRGARQMIDHLSESMKTLLSEIGAIGRWLTASLLAVNGAGVLAVFNANEKLAHPVVDASPFAAGVLAALASGVLLQRASIQGAQIAGEVMGHSVVVEQTGVLTREAKELVAAMGPRARRNGLWPQLAGWISAMLFATGAVATGVTGGKVDPANDRRCLVIQHDMLAAHPTRADDVPLFQALGCKPQGIEP